MKTSIVEVGGLLSALSSRGVDKRLMRLPGVHHVEANYVAGSATVTYDEKVTDLKVIKAAIEDCGYHCAGEMLPKHVCEPRDPPATTAEAHADHDDHAHNARRELWRPSGAPESGVRLAVSGLVHVSQEKH